MTDLTDLGIAGIRDSVQNENLELPGGPLRKQFLFNALQLLLIATVQDDIEALRRKLLCESQADTVRGSGHDGPWFALATFLVFAQVVRTQEVVPSEAAELIELRERPQAS